MMVEWDNMVLVAKTPDNNVMHAKPGLRAEFLLARLSSRLGDHWRYTTLTD